MEKYPLNFPDRFSENTQTSNLMKVLLVGAEFHADGRKDTHDEANSRFSQFCYRA
jgi:hypothetical protein